MLAVPELACGCNLNMESDLSGKSPSLLAQFLEGLASLSALHFPASDHPRTEEESICNKFREFVQSNRFFLGEEGNQSSHWPGPISPGEESVEDAETTRFVEECISDPDFRLAEPNQELGFLAGQPTKPAHNAGFSGCKWERPICDIFTAAESAEEMLSTSASIFGPCPVPKMEQFDVRVVQASSENLGSAGRDEFVESCFIDEGSSDELELIVNLEAGSPMRIEASSQHQGVPEEPDEDLPSPPFCDKRFRKPRSVKKLARYQQHCILGRSQEVIDDVESIPAREAKAALPKRWGSGSPALKDQELVQVLVALRELRKSSAESQRAFIEHLELDYKIQFTDLYDCSEASLDEFATTRRSPLYFIMRTKYSDGRNGKKVTRLRSPPVRRGSRNFLIPPCRRWMQRGKSKISNLEGPACLYGKTYFSYGLRDFVDRRTKRKKLKGAVGHRRHQQDDVTSASNEFESSESQDLEEEEGEEAEDQPYACRLMSVLGHRRKRPPTLKLVQPRLHINDFQMYELYLKEDVERDKEKRKLKTAPKPYWVICVLKYDNSH